VYHELLWHRQPVGELNTRLQEVVGSFLIFVHGIQGWKEEKVEFLADFPTHRGSEVTSWGQAQIWL
jgi:hypothetical protein